MEIIKLPIKGINMNYDEHERFNNLGLDIDEEDLINLELYVNVNHIVAFNKDNEGNTTLYLANDPVPIMVYIKFEEFLKLINVK